MPFRRNPSLDWPGTGAVERWLEAERDQLVLWLPVTFGVGVAAWFVLGDLWAWQVLALAALAGGLGCLAVGRAGRLARASGIGLLMVALGVGCAWWRAERVAAPVLARPVVAMVTGRVEAIDRLAARGVMRLTIATTGGGLPKRVRVNLAEADAPAALTVGAGVSLRARLMPPPGPAVPGAYDFARVAWFGGLGATGRGFAPVAVTAPGEASAGLRERLTRHINDRLEGSRGGIAAALVTGDEGAIEEADAEAMRRAGLAHLLSVSGLHITAVVAATMVIVLRLLALSPWLALRVRLPLVAAVAGAVAAIGYTWLTGAQVPTIRSCVAALLVLAALAVGREAMTLRLVATGALVVLVFRPEALVGPSFQLSFAAITAIVALHEQPRIRAFFEPHDEGRIRGVGRSLASLLVTGVVVELALMPIAMFHFHKAGVYGALANIVAIPLTTFVIMPIEALALVFDLVGAGAPFWWLAGQAVTALLWIARTVAAAPGSVVALPSMPVGAFAIMVGGGLWLALWRTWWRALGVVPLAAGAVWALVTPPPDLLVTGDGRHVAVRTGDGLALLRERTGDYTRSTLAENGGTDGEPLLLDGRREARCSRDLCIVDLMREGRRWRVMATRSGYLVPAGQLIAACGQADVAVSERGLPRRCRPRWLRLDRQTLAHTGGVAVRFAGGWVVTVRQPGDQHPWMVAETVMPPRLRTAEGGRCPPTSC
ncbi:competence protein ComEC [Sphingomonas jinjuensis]|uniref:Competence protein ComEC n=1 Tax=Sphingomonas jinjuensis TaxID=535907 RepID=A0A840FHM3_9SPHN|nr:ComEC/Rec2 family competence protein [Sphingomonas jinjuensis]MBB4153468.1 competence protein ComEC [Sphingomonas jinjuensis]